MKLLVTGDREWTDREMVYQALSQLPAGTELIHGGCRGLDTIAGEIALELGWPAPHPYYANWNLWRKAAGPMRNRQMLDTEKPDLVYAFHDDLWGRSKGTKNMVDYAREQGYDVTLFTHKGVSVLKGDDHL